MEKFELSNQEAKVGEIKDLLNKQREYLNALREALAQGKWAPIYAGEAEKAEQMARDEVLLAEESARNRAPMPERLGVFRELEQEAWELLREERNLLREALKDPSNRK